MLENRSGATPPATQYHGMTPGIFPPPEGIPYSPQPNQNQRKRSYSMIMQGHEQLQDYARAPANPVNMDFEGVDGRRNSNEMHHISSETLEGSVDEKYGFICKI